jgi:signal transduction histidine kinase
LRYHRERLVLSISDDGDGDPVQLRRTLQLAAATDLAGAHRGLVNMLTRVTELGGTLSIRRSQLGGIMLLLRIPLPLATPTERAAG